MSLDQVPSASFTLFIALGVGRVGDADGRADDANALNRCLASASGARLQHRTEVHTQRGHATLGRKIR